MKFLTSFDLKILAIILMVIDHIGLFFLPQYFILRVIGRLSFPLFAFLIANGAVNTTNIYKYAQRLFIFAVISQVPFFLANRQIDKSFWELNVLFTLFLGLLAIIGIKNVKNVILKYLFVFICVLSAMVLKTDYGAMGVLTIIGFYIFYSSFFKMVIAQIIIFFIIPLLLLILRPVTFFDPSLYFSSFIEPVGLCSLLFIGSYNGKKGREAKYLFYIFYPFQYVIIYLFLMIR